MGTLAWALHWAERGYPVFPLRENEKEPAFDDWVELATTDADTLRRVWTDPVLRMERNYNIGMLCTDMVVVDIDVKSGKNGLEEYLQLGGHYETLVVQTPSGGFHCYFNGPDSSNAPLSKAVDVRSHNGFVVAPGSSIDGVPYSIVRDGDVAWVPASIERILKPPYVRNEVSEAALLDTPASIQAGINFLQSAPLAVEGMRGDETTFMTAARLVREMALSPDAAFMLMRDYWNDRCSPPWNLDELWGKVQNANDYGSADHGRLSADALFGHLQIPEQPSLFTQIGTPWGNGVTSAAIKPRKWLVDRMLMHGAVTLLMAAGSAGKSSVSLALAAHLALGMDFAGYKAAKACKTIVYNGEDDLEEQSRRLLAVCMAYGFDYNIVKNQIMLLSSRQIKLDLVAKEQYRLQRNDVVVKQLTEMASDPDVGLLILDPLVKIHRVDESDNVQMDFVMETLTDIAYGADISVLALHHTAKGGSSRQEERIGNMDIARGASAIVNAARIGFTLLNASMEDAEMYGLQDNERNMWVRMDDAKMNLALASQNATWFHKEGVRIPSMDIVGVMRHEPLERSHNHIRTRVGRILVQTMKANNAGSMTLIQAVAVLKAEEPLWANKTDTDIRRKIEGMFAVTTSIEGHNLKIQRDLNDKNDRVLIVLT